MSDQKQPTHSLIAWHRSVRTRLSAVAAFLVLLATLALSLPSAFSSFSKEVGFVAEQVEGVADVMAMSVSAPLAEGETGQITRALGAVGRIQRLEFAIVLDQQGASVTRVGTGSFLTDNIEAMGSINAWTLFERDTFWVEAPVVFAGKTIGSLHLLTDLSDLRDAFLRQLVFSFLIALSVALLGGLAVFFSVTRMTKPLASLSGLMEMLGQKAQPGLRAEMVSRDEIGALAGSFNAMLDKLEARDRDLNDYRLHLEDKVDLRTQELKDATQAAEAANGAKSEFLATMSHEIRTPMNGMMVMAEMLAASDLPPRQKRQAAIIQRSGSSLLAIINDILDLSKIEAGAIDLESIPFSLETLFDDTASLYGDRAREADLALATTIAPDVPGRFCGDPTRLSQIITNLVSNALKFTKQGGVHVHASMTPAMIEGHDPMLEIRVKDTGIGIAPEKQGAIFEAFTQAEQSTARQFGGTGLGLSICARLAEAMGGGIRLESALGSGSTFIVTVPLPSDAPAIAHQTAELADTHFAVLCENAFVEDIILDTVGAYGGTVFATVDDIDTERLTGVRSVIILADAGALARPMIAQIIARSQCPVVRLASSEESAMSKTPVDVDAVLPISLGPQIIRRLGEVARSGDGAVLRTQTADSGHAQPELPQFVGLRVLAVDDNAVNREVIVETLAALGVTADFAENGPDAIAMAKEAAYDLIFMDCSMPGMDGYEATRRIRSDEAGSGRKAVRIAALTAHVGGSSMTAHLDAGMNDYITKPFTIADIAGALERVGTKRPMLTLVADTKEPAQPDTSGQTKQAKTHEDVEVLSVESIKMYRQLGTPMLIKVLTMYLSHGPDGLQRLKAAVDADAPAQEIADLAHALKSMSASSAAERMRHHAEMIELAANDGCRPTSAELDAASSIMDTTLQAMDAIIIAEDASTAKGR